MAENLFKNDRCNIYFISKTKHSTFYSIANRNNVDINDLIQVNPQIINPHNLEPGQSIFLPVWNPEIEPYRPNSYFGHVINLG